MAVHAVVVKVQPIWPLALCAGLLGIGQNGLLVMLPQLVQMTGLSLSIWAGLLMFGSMLFLPCSPWWGKVAEQRGCKWVVLAALVGYLTSFTIMAGSVYGMHVGKMPFYLGLTGLILSRLIYGATVSGLVPAAQTWSMQRKGEQHRMSALAVISSGLSLGRLLGPPLAAGLLAVDPLAPLALMAIAPLLAVVLVIKQTNNKALARAATQSVTLRLRHWPWLCLATLLALTISLLQLALSSHLNQSGVLASEQISHAVALALSLAALSTLATQMIIIRPQYFSARYLLLSGAVLLAMGLSLMILQSLWAFYLGMTINAIGAAMVTPAYQLLLNEQLTSGKGAGYIATSHTLGYGLSALLIPMITHQYGATSLLPAAMIVSYLFLLLTLSVWRRAVE